MKKLIMFQGLPGSGKTTEALRLVRASSLGMQPRAVYSTVRVNKDDIRVELGGEWNKDLEARVVMLRDARIVDALSQPEVDTVIVDDTNFAPHHRKRLQELAQQNGASFHIRRFTVPLEECVRRCMARTTQAHVPEKAIRDMAARYSVGKEIVYPDVEPVPSTAKDGTPLMRAIICDLDGTLSLFERKGHRGPYDTAKCDQDEVNTVVRELLSRYYSTLYQIVYCSGRSDKFRPQTTSWLQHHYCPPGPLLMRVEGDLRKDWVVKHELFDAHIRGRYDVRFCLDDRNQVVNFWRHLGLPCFQVAPGDF